MFLIFGLWPKYYPTPVFPTPARFCSKDTATNQTGLSQSPSLQPVSGPREVYFTSLLIQRHSGIPSKSTSLPYFSLFLAQRPSGTPNMPTPLQIVSGLRTQLSPKQAYTRVPSTPACFCSKDISGPWRESSSLQCVSGLQTQRSTKRAYTRVPPIPACLWGWASGGSSRSQTSGYGDDTREDLLCHGVGTATQPGEAGGKHGGLTLPLGMDKHTALLNSRHSQQGVGSFVLLRDAWGRWGDREVGWGDGWEGGGPGAIHTGILREKSCCHVLMFQSRKCPWCDIGCFLL